MAKTLPDSRNLLRRQLIIAGATPHEVEQQLGRVVLLRVGQLADFRDFSRTGLN
ncbi:hypothetical protein [Xanthobacter sp. KR7-225]|uniref:hypothetical protein n=1 Tax=Xanthobacter sp. KR7-225 TaxID=3156613 RepID=UPI0032B4F370